MSSDGGLESTHPIRQTLELESLDAEGLWQALNNVEKALPHLLSCLKPVLARLSEGSLPEEGDGQEAIRDYMAILDDIQNVLRQATFYLKATKTSPSTVDPPPPTSIPTPFASTLPRNIGIMQDRVEEGDKEEDETDGRAEQAELGLYASRIELRTLRAMTKSLAALRRERGMGQRSRDPSPAEAERDAGESGG